MAIQLLKSVIYYVSAMDVIVQFVRVAIDDANDVNTLHVHGRQVKVSFTGP